MSRRSTSKVFQIFPEKIVQLVEENLISGLFQCLKCFGHPRWCRIKSGTWNFSSSQKRTYKCWPGDSAAVTIIWSLTGGHQQGSLNHPKKTAQRIASQKKVSKCFSFFCLMKPCSSIPTSATPDQVQVWRLETLVRTHGGCVCFWDTKMMGKDLQVIRDLSTCYVLSFPTVSGVGP